MTIMNVSYTILILNMVSVEDNFQVGYFTTGILGVYIGFCLLVQIISSTFGIKLVWRKRMAKRSHKKQRAKL